MGRLGKGLVLMVSVLFIILVMVGCTTHNGIKIMWKNHSTSSSMAGSYKLFSGEDIKKITFKGREVVFTYDSDVQKGELEMYIEDEQNNKIVKFDPGVSGTKTVSVAEEESYKIIVKGKSTQGSYSVSWKVN